MALSDERHPWLHSSWPAHASLQPQYQHPKEEEQELAGAKQAARTNSSASSSFNIKLHAAGVSHGLKRRRKSRGRPSPPVTCISANSTAHFKALVHHFTGHGGPQLHPSLQLFCASTPPSSDASLAMAQSLKSTLQILVACLRLLHGSSSPPPSIAIPQAALDICKSKALDLWKALDSSRRAVASNVSNGPMPHNDSHVKSSVPTPPSSLCLSSALPNQTQSNPKQTHNGLSRDNTFSDLNPKDVQHTQLQHPPTTLPTSRNHTPAQTACTTARHDGTRRSSPLRHRDMELESFLLEGNKVDDYFTRDFSLFKQPASQCGMLAST